MLFSACYWPLAYNLSPNVNLSVVKKTDKYDREIITNIKIWGIGENYITHTHIPSGLELISPTSSSVIRLWKPSHYIIIDVPCAFERAYVCGHMYNSNLGLIDKSDKELLKITTELEKVIINSVED